MEMDLVPDDPQDLQNAHVPSDDFEFGSWMIFSRRHGCARSRETGSRLGLASIGAATEENTAPTLPHNVPSRATWVGMKSRGLGGTSVSRASRFHYYNTDGVPMKDSPVPMALTVEMHVSMPPRNFNSVESSDKRASFSNSE